MKPQEVRFFAIYLSRINPNDESTRVVRFTLGDFQAIMDIGRVSIKYMKSVTNSLLSKVVNVQDEKTGGYMGFQLFKKCTVGTDDSGEWFVEINAHDDALPLMFNYKRDFFKYPLWNALRLRGRNQLRMYEILKQHEFKGSVVFSVEELKDSLFIEKDEYPRFGNFKIRVLDACQQALRDFTDIKFTYEPYGKRGQGGKVLNLKFYIKKNEGFADQLTLDMFIEEQAQELSSGTWPEPDDEFASEYKERINFFMEACRNEFSFNEMVVLFNEMQKYLPDQLIESDVRCYDHISEKYREMIMYDEKTKIRNRFSYIKSIIGND